VTYLAVSAVSHAGAVRDHHEDSLAVGPWTLCAIVTDNPQTLVFPLGPPLVLASDCYPGVGAPLPRAPADHAPVKEPVAERTQTVSATRRGRDHRPSAGARRAS
jgi:hypothetical protein